MHLEEDSAGFSEIIASRSAPNERFLNEMIPEFIMPEAAASPTYQERACRN